MNENMQAISSLGCIGGHQWIYSGILPEGAPCICGKEKYVAQPTVSDLQKQITNLRERIEKIEMNNSVR